MTRIVPPEADAPSPRRAELGDPALRVLVCSGSPPGGIGRCVDVQPGHSTTFDGDRVRLPLIVTGARRRQRVAWVDLRGLDVAVTSMLKPDTVTIVRFGDRSVCRRLLGPNPTAAVERRLATTAQEAGARFITWTDRPRRQEDSTSYDVVVDATSRSD